MAIARSTRDSGPGLAVVLFLASAASVVRADYKDSYRKGMDAIDRRDWTEAARLLGQAVSERPKEGGEVKLYGMRFAPYLPHYYLGLALLAKGDCRAALKQWDISLAQGVISQTGEYAALLESQKECRARLAAGEAARARATPDPALLARALQTAEAQVAEAEGASKAAASMQIDVDLAPIWQQDVFLGGAQKEAASALASAQAEFDRGKQGSDLGQLAEATNLAARAARQFASVRKAAEARREELQQRRAPAAHDTARGQRTPPPVSLAPSATLEPPTELVAGAQAYFDGRYKEAAEHLRRAQQLPGRAAAFGYLFRAAAQYGLYLVGGESDERLRQAAVADVRACSRIDTRVFPDAQVFSPRFIEFFKASRSFSTGD